MRRGSLYVDVNSPLHRLHPLTKMTVLAASFLLAFAREPSAEHPMPTGPWILLAAVLACACWGRVLRPMLRGVFRIIAPMMLSLFVIRVLLYGSSGHVMFYFGALPIMREGMQQAADICTRLLVSVSAFLLLLQTTHPGRLTQALVQKGAPPWLGHVIVSAFQMIPEARDRARAITEAQLARGLRVKQNMLGRARAVPPLVAPLLLSMLADTEEQAMALEARGFSRRGARSSLVEIGELPFEPAVRWFCLVAGAAGFMWLRGWFS